MRRTTGVGRWITWSAIAMVGFGCVSKRSRAGDNVGKVAETADASSAALDEVPVGCPPGEVEFCGQRFAPDTPTVACQDPQIADLGPLACLPKVDFVSLQGVKSTDLTPLARLNQIRSITLFEMPVTDLSPLTGLVHLEHLGLYYLPVKDITVVGGFTQLKWLKLANLNVDDLSPLAHIHQLEEIHLDSIGARDMSPLAGHAGLREAHFDHMDLPDLRPLVGLPIEYLALLACEVADLSPLRSIGTLKRLDLGGTRVQPEQLNALRAKNPGLVVN